MAVRRQWVVLVFLETEDVPPHDEVQEAIELCLDHIDLPAIRSFDVVRVDLQP